MIHIDKNPKDKALKTFVWSTVAICAFVFIVLVFFAKVFQADFGFKAFLACFVGVIGVVTLIANFLPRQILKKWYIFVNYLLFPIGFVIGTVLLFLLFILIFTPLALFFKLVGRDELKLKNFESESYWIKCKETPPGPRYYKQY